MLASCSEEQLGELEAAFPDQLGTYRSNCPVTVTAPMIFSDHYNILFNAREGVELYGTTGTVFERLLRIETASAPKDAVCFTQFTILLLNNGKVYRIDHDNHGVTELVLPAVKSIIKSGTMSVAFITFSLKIYTVEGLGEPLLTDGESVLNVLGPGIIHSYGGYCYLTPRGVEWVAAREALLPAYRLSLYRNGQDYISTELFARKKYTSGNRRKLILTDKGTIVFSNRDTLQLVPLPSKAVTFEISIDLLRGQMDSIKETAFILLETGELYSSDLESYGSLSFVPFGERIQQILTSGITVFFLTWSGKLYQFNRYAVLIALPPVRKMAVERDKIFLLTICGKLFIRPIEVDIAVIPLFYAIPIILPLLLGETVADLFESTTAPQVIAVTSQFRLLSLKK